MKKIFLLFTICLLTTTIQAQWIQKGTDINGDTAGDRSGSTTSLSSDGNTIVIGAIWNDGEASNAGHVRIYEWNGSSWGQKGVDIDGEAASDNNGWSVSLSSDGNTIAMGAPENDETGVGAGHVRIYEWNGSSWDQKGVDIDGEAMEDVSGRSVSLSSDGNIVAIGAPGNNGSGHEAGHVRIYEWNGSSWIQKGADIDGEAEGDLSGWSLSMSLDGNTLAIGALGNDEMGERAGHVRIYEWSGSSWDQKGADIDGEAAGDRSGVSVSLSSDGDTIAIGADRNDGVGMSAGHVRIYEWGGSGWTQKGLDINGEEVSDQSGFSVSMSSDGNTIAIGAYWSNGGGIHAGHARIYSWNGIGWIQKGIDIDGEEGDNSGKSVSLSSDGNIVVIGAPKNSGIIGVEAGRVRIYNFIEEVGVSENNFSSELKLYPNPTNGNFVVDLGDNYNNPKIIITDLSGRIIQSNTYNKTHLVNLRLEAPAGVYLLIVESEDEKVTMKLIKE